MGSHGASVVGFKTIPRPGQNETTSKTSAIASSSSTATVVAAAIRLL